MVELKFISGLGNYLLEFIEQKRAMGCIYRTQSYVLMQFDRFVNDHFPQASTLTREICEAWLVFVDTGHPNSVQKNASYLKPFAKYLRSIGQEAYVIPSNISGHIQKYVPHIYTEDELRAFFDAVDRCTKSSSNPVKHLVVPAIFRMLFCCGMRSSEARLLKCSDVDLKSGAITIRESKGWQARVIYISESLRNYLVGYEKSITKIMPVRTAFFPNRYGNCYATNAIDSWFHEAWDPLEVAKRVTGNSPRVHDFRHTFAVRRLNKWVGDGADINAMLPYLSQYMGHVKFADTDYYLHLCEEFYPELDSRMKSVNANILPEVEYEN